MIPLLVLLASEKLAYTLRGNRQDQFREGDINLCVNGVINHICLNIYNQCFSPKNEVFYVATPIFIKGLQIAFESS